MKSNHWIRLTVFLVGSGLLSLAIFEDKWDLSCDCVWVSLFNGQDLEGWHPLNGSAPFVVEDDAIVGKTVEDSPNSFLATKASYGDFILEFEVLMDEERPFNSGVQFRSLSTADDRDGRVHGYQCEIDPSSKGTSGGIYDEAGRGWLYRGASTEAAQHAFRSGRWNRFRVEAIGYHLRTWVNSVPIAHVIDEVSDRGFIALQVHAIDPGLGLAGATVRWRDLRIQTENLVASPPTPEIEVRDLRVTAMEPMKQ